jgi:heme exporter protein D
VGAAAEVGGMNWGGVNEFLAMGGYGSYVWGSYGVAALCIFLEVFFLRNKRQEP